MRITVLGKSPSWPDAGGACSGYLVQSGAYTLLLDCGTGVFAALRQVVDYLAVDAVLISHLHSDHFFDLVPYSYALLHGPRAHGHRPVRLHAPPAARDVFEGMVGAWSDPGLIPSAFELREYDPGQSLALGPLTAHFAEVPHYTTTYAVRIDDGSASVTYSADCGPNPALVQFARDTDLLLVEATLPGLEEGAADDEADDADPRGHLTAREAGEHGRQAGARRVVITHFSDELDRERLQAEARAGYAGPVDVAQAGAAYDVISRETA